MADSTSRLEIIVEVKNGRASAAEVQGVATATKNVGTQTEEATKKTSRLKGALGGLAAGYAA